MIDTHQLALILMAAQGCLGAFDTLYHHELTEALAQHKTARRELAIHAVRALIYSLLFIGLSAWAWHGGWAWVLVTLLGIEIVLTLWDFVVEDRTRLLPATERITHTLLAINGGAFIVLLVLNLPVWLAEPTGLSWQPQGYLSAFLMLCGIGVGLSGVRDGLAARALGRRMLAERARPALRFFATPQHVLVTGGTGFIGQLLVRALLADGNTVSLLTRSPKRAAWLLDGSVRCVTQCSDLPAAMPVDVVINLAGAPILGLPWTAARQAVLRQSRVGLTQNLVAWIAQTPHKPRLLFSASAVGYYGIQAQGDTTALTEQSPPQPVFMSQLCQAWEAEAVAAAAHGVQVIVMRFGLVLGQQGALPMMLLPIKLGLGGSLGSGRQWLAWIHVQDLLGAIAYLGQQSRQDGAGTVQVYNFTAPESVTQREFSQTSASVLHRPSFFPTPGWPLRLVLGEQTDILLEGQRVVPAALLKSGFEFRYPNLRSAIQDLSG